MIRVRQIEINIEEYTPKELRKKLSKKLKIKESEIKTIQINKKSIDARKKPKISFIYEVDVNLTNENSILKKNKNNDILKTPIEKYTFPKIGNKKMTKCPIIVGSGPAGLFCAYLLAEHGYKPLIIERGEKVEDRVTTVETFWKTGQLNKNSNVQFGEGGAGTFSDGKLNTLVKDKNNRMKKVFEIFVENGANKNILYENHPHIGTDILRKVVINMRNKIINQGGTFLYNTCLTNLRIENNQIKSIQLNNKEWLDCQTLILAIGHSARDTFKMLLEQGLTLIPKPFAVGIRIEHPQTMINKAQYGIANHPILPPASYKLTYHSNNGRGVYSFCMCPGGYVVNASSEENKLAINGMSYSQRDSKNANSAIVVTVGPNDYGTNPLDGVKFQQNLEEKAYNLGNGKIPIQLWKDYQNNTKSTKFGSIKPIYKGKYQLTNLNQLFPNYINDSLKEAIPYFEKKIPGFAREDALLAGIESRTSSPIRITRDELYESNVKGIYPCGEGAGYAGGITTSAMDGIKIAEIIASTYNNI